MKKKLHSHMPETNESKVQQRSLIEMRDVSVSKNGKIILDSIDMSVHSGENIAIIGPNGSGKSSIIKIITGEYRPLQKNDMILRMFGKDSWDLFSLRNSLGIVSGTLQTNYERDINGFDVVLSGFFSSIGIYPNHKVKPEMIETVFEVMKFLELTQLRNKLISEMSTGEARRLLIARALVHDPDILVLDEPANSLDLKSHHQFREITRKIAAAGKSIVLVTHDLEDVIPEIGRVILIKDGKIFADGKKEDILNDKKLSELFGISITISESNGYYHAWCQ
jgi:iron complex transport system ATP-binding protein